MDGARRGEGGRVPRRVQAGGGGAELRTVGTHAPTLRMVDGMVSELVPEDGEDGRDAVLAEEVVRDRDRVRRTIDAGATREATGDSDKRRGQRRRPRGRECCRQPAKVREGWITRAAHQR